MQFPKSFDIKIYKKFNNQLSSFTDIELIDHYNKFGKHEGFLCIEIKNRLDFFNLINILNVNNGLEIGPLCNMILSDTNIKNKKTLDFFSQEELINNYKNDINVNINNIIKVDYVMKNINKYTDIINETFDVCVSSHNLEHMPCIVTFLNNISSILNKGGYLFLAIPDYRYCFDKYRNPSTIFDVLFKYYTKCEKPCPISILESSFIRTHNNSSDHWKNFETTYQNCFNNINDNFDFINTYKNTIATNINDIKNIIHNNDTYIDSHCWKLNPETFSIIIEILLECKLIDLNLIVKYGTYKNSHEFYVILQKSL